MYVAPSGASFGVYSCCMRLSGKAATVLGFSPRMTGRRVRLGRVLRRVSARAWPVAREVPVGWYLPDRDPRPGDVRLAICGPALIPAVFSAPLSGCSRQRGRLVCVPL